jgi:magnesium transporter
MIVPDGADSLLQLFHNNMNDWAESSGVSFEVRAYEAIFSTVISIHNQDCIELQIAVDSVLSEFKRASIIPIERQEQMRILKNKVTGQLSMILAYRRTIEELLEDDGDLALLNLSALKPKPALYNLPLSQEILSYHEEMEIIMESYIMDYNSLQSKLDYLKSQMQSAEELVMLRLDTSRNQLLIADTVISVVACCLAMGSFVGSIYGMNLKNHMEEDPHMFTVVLWLTVFGIIILGLSTIAYFKMTGVLPSESKYRTIFVDVFHSLFLSYPIPIIISKITYNLSHALIRYIACRQTPQTV